MKLIGFLRKVMSLLSITVVITMYSYQAKADKGMWLLNELNKENIERLRQLGFNLSVDSLYNLNKPSIANSVVIFGSGCTGVTVSQEGLIFTNHHCGFGAIQSQSTVSHDYLQNGFVSHSNREELPIEGLEVKYLYSIDDVTSEIMKGIENKASVDNIKLIQDRIQKMSDECNSQLKNSNQEVEVVSYYQYNKFYKIVYNVFKDVRLVFAPPSSLGKFGGDTDNWMYPRHTADFSVFRVYADKNNKPTTYSKDNKPYNPKYYATISVQGYKENSFAMTIGFPGSTDRYSPSWGIEKTINSENIPRIYVRGIKQQIWKKAMDSDPATRIKYASKYAQSSNYWKNAIGMNRGIKKLNVLGRKANEEAEFQKWANKKSNKSVYGNVLNDLKRNYESLYAPEADLTYIVEALVRGTDVYKYSNVLDIISNTNNISLEKKEDIVNKFFKDFSLSLDKSVMSAMLDIVYDKVKTKSYIDPIDSLIKSYGGKNSFIDHLYSASISNPNDILKQLHDNKSLSYHNDPAYKFGKAVYKSIMSIRKNIYEKELLIDDNLRLYFAGRRAMNPKRLMPSDANFTMRMSYGSVKGYSPADAVKYNYYTTVLGVLSKNATEEEDYYLLPSVKNLMQENKWGRWADRRSKTLQTCFISTNDITGGNSGSPVFDGNGRLLGLAFDGNWEAMSGDIEFEPELQRTIVADIRYILWTIDIWGKCPRLINELKMM